MACLKLVIGAATRLVLIVHALAAVWSVVELRGGGGNGGNAWYWLLASPLPLIASEGIASLCNKGQLEIEW